MSEKFLSFGPLDPSDTFEGLTGLANAIRGLPPERLSCTFESPGIVKLWSAPPGRSDRGLDALLSKQFGKPVATTEPPKNRVPLNQALVRQLLETQLPRTGSAAEPISKKYMLVGYGMDKLQFERAANLLRRPNIRVQVARLTSDDRIPVCLFYLADNSNQPDPADGMEKFLQRQLGDYGVLRAYQVGAQILFLPLHLQFSPHVLNQFGDLVRAAPELWRREPGTTRSEFLFAVEGTPNKDGMPGTLFRAFYLAHLEFVTQEFGAAQIEIHRLNQSAQEVKQLRDRIGNSQAPWGYTLELHRMEQTGPSRAARDVELVRRRINELQQLVAYLESVQVERPRLLRFTQQQLPALANVLANYPQTLLADGKILYGFESSASAPGGLHYLLIPAGTDPMARPNPVLLWAHLEKCEMRFWLDPYWAKEYYDPVVIKTGKEPDYLVFVPEWTAMYPAFHDWDATMIEADAARFMRESVQQWSNRSRTSTAAKDKSPAPNLPTKPFYLLDNSAERTIHISVLEGKGFKPLKTRLDWLNQNLSLNSELGNADFIARLADAKERQILAETYAQGALDAERRFKAQAAMIDNRIAQTMQEMTTHVSEQLNALNTEILKAFNDTRQLNADLQKLRANYGDLNAAREHVEKGFQDTQKFLTDLDKNAQALETRTNTTVANARTLRDAAQKHVDALVKELQTDIAKIKGRLSEPRWSR